MRQDAYGSFGRRLERTPPSWHRCGTDSVPQCGTSQDSMGRWCAGNPYRTGLCATQDDFSISSDSDSNPVGLPKNPRIYEVFCHLERFRLPIGHRALDWHAGLLLPSRSLDQQTSPQYSRLLNPSSHWQTDTNVANVPRDALFAIRYASAVETSPFFEARSSN